jgi:hypothetical protein
LDLLEKEGICPIAMLFYPVVLMLALLKNFGSCDELSQYRTSDASIVERNPDQLVVLIQESKAKEEEEEH